MRSSAARTSLAARTAAAGMDGDVQRGADVRLQILEERLERLQLGFRSLLQRAPHSLEQFADLPLVVRLAAPEGERRPQRLAHLLQQFLQRATRPGGGIVDVPALESLAGIPENVRRFILRRPRPGGVAPGRELEPAPGRRAAAQMFEELLIVREDDELPVGEPVGEKLGEPSAVLDVEAVDHVVEHEKADLLVEAFRHRQKERDRERVQVRLAEHAMRRALTRAVELDRQLDALGRPRLDAHRIEVLARMERGSRSGRHAG